MSETFGRYTVVRQLGQGAMGVVYLANDPLLNRQVAIKTVDLQIESEEDREFLRGRLLRDARAAAVLQHPHIVAVHDVFEDGGRAYVVMEYVEGENLATMLKANPLPNSAVVVKLLREMAEALDYTHAHGVIHRDIKPANVMIDSHGAAKIMDFGIARISDTRTMTPTGMVMGTVEYMAPEQIMGIAIDGRADLFALAVVAYQMLTGSTLFGPNTLATLTYKIVNEAPPPPCTRNAALPKGVDAVLTRALAKKPADRYANCGEFVNALAVAFADAPTAPLATPAIPMTPLPQAAVSPTQVTTVAMPPPPPPRRSSRAGLVVAAIAAALLVGAGFTLLAWRPWEHKAEPEPAAAVATPAAATPVEPAKPKAKVRAEPKAEAVKEPSQPAETAAVPVPPPPPPPVESKPEPKVEAKPESPAAAAVGKPAAELEPLVDPEPMAPPPEPKGGANTPFDMAVRRGHEQVKENDYPGAIQSFSKALSLRPRAAMTYLFRGQAYQHQEQFEAAIQDFKDAVRLDSTLPGPHVQMGLSLVRLKRDQEALPEFQKAIELNPKALLAFMGRAGINYRRRQYRLAIADFSQAIVVNPKYGPAYANRAKAEEAVGDFSRAKADRQREAELRGH